MRANFYSSKIYILFVIISVCQFVHEDVFAASSTCQEVIETLEGRLGTGTYRGLTPTDETPSGSGELHIWFDGKNVRLKAATGLGIEEATLDPSEFKLMTAEELTSYYGGDSNHVIGFKRPGGKRALTFIFNRNPSFFDPNVLYAGIMGDYLAPTFLYSPRQKWIFKLGLYLSEVEYRFLKASREFRGLRQLGAYFGALFAPSKNWGRSIPRINDAAPAIQE